MNSVLPNIEIRHSFVIPCFNQENFIEKAVESVCSQTEPPYELIILDDCSTDQTVNVALSCLKRLKPFFPYKIVVNKKNMGIPRNMKKAAEVASGNVISMLGGDDYFLPHTVQEVRKSIQLYGIDPDADLYVCFSTSIEFFPELDQTKEIKYKVINNSILTSAIRKTASFVKVGFSRKLMKTAIYPESIGLWADWFWDVSLAMNANSYYVLGRPCFVHTSGVGVSSKALVADLEISYLKSCNLILTTYGTRIKIIERIYLMGERYYYLGKINNSYIYKTLGFLFFIFNLFTTPSIISFKSSLIRYLPNFIVNLIRRIKKWI